MHLRKCVKFNNSSCAFVALGDSLEECDKKINRMILKYQKEFKCHIVEIVNDLYFTRIKKNN